MKILIVSDKTIEGYFAAESLTRGFTELFSDDEILNTTISSSEFLATQNYIELVNKFSVDQIFILGLSVSSAMISSAFPIPIIVIDNHALSSESYKDTATMIGNLVMHVNQGESVFLTVEHFLQYLRANKDRIGKPQLPHFWQNLLTKYSTISKDKFATTMMTQIISDYSLGNETNRSVIAKLSITDQAKISMEYISEIRKDENAFIEKARTEFEILNPLLSTMITDVARLAVCKVIMGGKEEEVAIMMDCNNAYRYFIIETAMKFGKPLIVRRDLRENQYLLIIQTLKESKINAYEIAKELSEGRPVHGRQHFASCTVTKNKIDLLFAST